MQALAEIAKSVRREPYVMAYSDCIFILGVALVLCIFALFLVEKKQADAAPGE